MRVAIVHDWLVTNTGAEKVLKSIIELYPQSDVYALVDFLDEHNEKEILNTHGVHTSFIQKLPFAKTSFRNYLPLFPTAIESFNLSQYDLIISSSWAVAKGVKIHSNQLHICYCHTPVRYAWDLYDEYTSSLRGVKKMLVTWTLARLQIWDVATVSRVDYFIANSQFVRERIKRIYNRESVVIYPPVDTNRFRCEVDKEEYYISVSRLVPYKKTKLIVEAFNNMKDRKLLVVGSGEDFDAIKSIAGDNVDVLGYMDDEALVALMKKAKGFVYAAVEDFGIVPIEAMACGTPVIALNDGGTAETVEDGVNGVHFQKQKVKDIIKAVIRFEEEKFDTKEISKSVEKYSTQRFKAEMKEYISTLIH